MLTLSGRGVRTGHQRQPEAAAVHAAMVGRMRAKVNQRAGHQPAGLTCPQEATDEDQSVSVAGKTPTYAVSSPTAANGGSAFWRSEPRLDRTRPSRVA
jgi:hypothetical protein